MVAELHTMDAMDVTDAGSGPQALAEADELHRYAQLLLDGSYSAAANSAVQFDEHNAGPWALRRRTTLLRHRVPVRRRAQGGSEPRTAVWTPGD